MKEQDESKESLKARVKLARATGLLTGAKWALEQVNDINKVGLIKLIDEVLELLK